VKDRLKKGRKNLSLRSKKTTQKRKGQNREGRKGETKKRKKQDQKVEGVKPKGHKGGCSAAVVQRV
jgi:hypothetical protein